jgi:hypothetical protein
MRDAIARLPGSRIREVAKNLRPSVQNAILFLGKSLKSGLDEGQVFDDLAARRASSERLRRDIWMFAQIVRAFVSKARHADPSVDQWGKLQSFAFVREFLGYFRAMGYPLLRVGDYPRFDGFMAAMAALNETDLLDPQRLEYESTEVAFYLPAAAVRRHLARVLVGCPFDRRAAAGAEAVHQRQQEAGRRA